MTNIVRGFQRTGIFPLNGNVFTAENLLLSVVQTNNQPGPLGHNGVSGQPIIVTNGGSVTGRFVAVSRSIAKSKRRNP